MKYLNENSWLSGDYILGTAYGKVNWSTSNKRKVTVSSKGKVSGKKAGKATITAKVGSDFIATCKVTVS